MKKRKNLKGFTLIELIIVMAIFGILMTAVMQVITPLNKLSKRASIQEANAAAVDNIKNYFEGTLRYADCIEVCVGGLTDNDGNPFDNTIPNPNFGKSEYVNYTASELMNKFGVKDYSGSKTAVDKERAAVINFIDNHYTNRTNAGTDDRLTGKVRMLKIDNRNGGIVSEYEWDFTAGYTFTKYETPDADGNQATSMERVNAQLSTTPKLINSVINPVYYEDYSFFITPGYNEMITQFDESVIEGFDLTDDTADDYYASVEKISHLSGAEYTNFSEDMFSLSVIAYRNDTDDSGNSLYRGSIPDDPSTATVNEFRNVFQSPFALSNVNMSLVNIKSEFAQNRVSDLYGPERRMGEKVGESETYNPETKVKGVGENWNYQMISGAQAPKINNKLFTHAEITTGSDECIYFIYTLPEYK